MKTIECNHNGNWLDRLLNSWPFCMDTEKIIPVWAFAFCKGLTGWRKWPVNNDSLFYNGLLFIRIMRPFWIGWSIRWGKRYLQAGIGWKLNGRFGVIFRIQTDESSAQGTHGHNTGHANGFECGNK